MCKYCNCIEIPMVDGKYGNGIESIESGSVFAHIVKTSDDRYLFEVNENIVYSFEIKYCPMCGRLLSEVK